MFSAPHLLTGLESLLLAAAGAVVGAFVAVRLARRWRSRGRAAIAIACALAASSLAVAPITAWAVIADIRAAHRLTELEAARIGPEENRLDTATIDRVAELIPRDETYALVFPDAVDPNRALVFRLWSLTALMPRVARVDPRSAQWVVAWGVPPRDLDVRLANVRRLKMADESEPPVYVGRVVG